MTKAEFCDKLMDYIIRHDKKGICELFRQLIYLDLGFEVSEIQKNLALAELGYYMIGDEAMLIHSIIRILEVG